MAFEYMDGNFNDVIQQIGDSMKTLIGELDNFQDIARYINPSSGEIPKLKGVDVYGETIALNGVVGGDHIIYLDFKRRYDLNARIAKALSRGQDDVVRKLNECRYKAGIVVADVSGHQITDALLAGMLHQAFLMGAIYEMDYYGNITPKLFENINTRFYNSSSVSKFLTMIYGEISEDGRFQFLSAGHPMPIVFSRKFDCIVEVPEGRRASFPPIGTLPSQRDIDRNTNKSILGFKEEYAVNEWDLLGNGDILILYTDGLIEHVREDEEYCPNHLERVLHTVKNKSAKEICKAIKKDMLEFNKPEDDISMVVIKWH